MIILIINVSNLDAVKSAQSKQSTKHKHNIYNKLTTKQKKKNYTQAKLKNYHKTHNVQLQSNLELCQRLISIFYSEFHCPNPPTGAMLICHGQCVLLYINNFLSHIQSLQFLLYVQRVFPDASVKKPLQSYPPDIFLLQLHFQHCSLVSS